MIKGLFLFFILINAAHSGVVGELREHTKEEKKQVKKVTYFDDSAEVTSSSSIFVIKKGAKLRKDLNYIILDKQIKAKVRYFPNKRYAKIINEKGQTLYEVAVSDIIPVNQSLKLDHEPLYFKEAVYEEEVIPIDPIKFGAQFIGGMLLGYDEFTSQLDTDDSETPNFFFSSNIGFEINVKLNRYFSFGAMATGQFGQYLLGVEMGTLKGFGGGLILRLTNLMPNFDFHLGVEHTFKNTLRNPIKDVEYDLEQYKKLFGVEYIKRVPAGGTWSLGGRFYEISMKSNNVLAGTNEPSYGIFGYIGREFEFTF